MHGTAHKSGLVNSARLILATTIALLCLASTTVFAQHVMDPNASSSDVEMESSPANDEILPQSPQDFMLRFSTYVRLVKLSVKGPDGKFVNVNFRYRTDASRVFFWDIPTLPDADYYTVEWAAIDPRNLIARGTFSFSFGPNAQLASELIPEEEVFDHVVTPDYRIQDQ